MDASVLVNPGFDSTEPSNSNPAATNATPIQANPMTGDEQPSGQNTIYQQPKAEGIRYKKSFKCVGIIQIVLGFTAIILEIVNISHTTFRNKYYFSLSFIGTGLWVGIMIVICGILGIRSSISQTRCPVIGGLVMTVIASICAALMVAVQVVGVFTAPYILQMIEVIRALHVTLAVVAFISMAVAIVHSSLSCANVCSCCGNNKAKKSAGTVVYMTYPQQHPNGSSGVVILNPYPGQQFVQQPYPGAANPPYTPQQYPPQGYPAQQPIPGQQPPPQPAMEKQEL